jgi:hypothetical protein
VRHVVYQAGLFQCFAVLQSERMNRNNTSCPSRSVFTVTPVYTELGLAPRLVSQKQGQGKWKESLITARSVSQKC